MERTVFAQHQAPVAAAARPYAGFGICFQWRNVSHSVMATAMASKAGLKSANATTKRTARHLGMAST